MKEIVDKDKVFATNRKAKHLYFIDDIYEAGISLLGTEVKSIKIGNVSLADSYAEITEGEVFLRNMHVSSYKQSGVFNHHPTRKRKLLLKKKEIRKLYVHINQRGYTLIPLSVYLRNGKIKIELALARGKKKFDKREKISKKDFERTKKRYLKYN